MLWVPNIGQTPFLKVKEGYYEHMAANSKSCGIELVVGLVYVVLIRVSQQSATFRLKVFTQYFI